MTEVASRIATPGGWMACTRAGSGPAIVLIHGLGSSRRTWRGIASRLAQTATVIAVDLPGHGESDPPHGDHSPHGFAAAVRDMLDALEIDEVDLVGHSLGGGVALSFAHLFPQRVRSVALVSSGGLGPEVTPLLRAVTLPGAEIALTAAACLPRLVRESALWGLSAVPGLVSRDDVGPLSECFDTLERDITRSAFVNTARAVMDMRGQSMQVGERISALPDHRLLLIWGDDDRTVPPHHHRALAARFPRATAVEIAGVGHFPQETAPTEVVAALEDFLRPAPAADAIVDEPVAYDP